MIFVTHRVRRGAQEPLDLPVAARGAACWYSAGTRRRCASRCAWSRRSAPARCSTRLNDFGKVVVGNADGPGAAGYLHHGRLPGAAGQHRPGRARRRDLPRHGQALARRIRAQGLHAVEARAGADLRGHLPRVAAAHLFRRAAGALRCSPMPTWRRRPTSRCSCCSWCASASSSPRRCAASRTTPRSRTSNLIALAINAALIVTLMPDTASGARRSASSSARPGRRSTSGARVLKRYQLPLSELCQWGKLGLALASSLVALAALHASQLYLPRGALGSARRSRGVRAGVHGSPRASSCARNTAT